MIDARWLMRILLRRLGSGTAFNLMKEQIEMLRNWAREGLDWLLSLSSGRIVFMVLQRSLEFANELVFSDGRVARTPQDIERIWQDELLRKEFVHQFYEGELIQWLRLIGRGKDASQLELLRERRPDVGEVLKELEALFLSVPEAVSHQPKEQLESPPPLKLDLIEQQRGVIRRFMEMDCGYYQDICRLNEDLCLQKTLLNNEMNNQTLRLQRSMDEVDKILDKAKTIKDLDITWPTPTSEDLGSVGYQASSEAMSVLNRVSSDLAASVRELESFKERLLREERRRQEEEEKEPGGTPRPKSRSHF